MAEENKEHEKHEHAEHKEHGGHKHMYMEHHQHKTHQSYKVAAWILGIICVILLAGLIVSLTMRGNGGTATEDKTVEEVKSVTETYLKSIANGDASVDTIVKEGNLYLVKLTVSGRQYDSYVTMDGKLLFPQGIDMTAPVDTATGTETQPAQTNVPKTDKPVVELFVMSHCPYGTQAEKGILPAVRALGDTIDFKIRFVYYAMHGEKEVTEQLTQYCIQSEQPDKYIKYLACFLNDSAGQGSATASAECITSAGVDKTKLASCKTKVDEEFGIMDSYNDQTTWLNGRFPKFDTDAALNTKYGVGGSPTLVINGVTSNAGRDSASYLSAICAAFNNAPEECSTTVSSTQPGPGFGYDSVGAANAAGCGV